jgi:predicted nucleotidyltransferase
MSAESIVTPEKEPNPNIISPATESLLNYGDPDNLWPKSILEDPKLHEAVKIRLDARESLQMIEGRILESTKDVNEALEEGLLEESNLTDLYKSFSKLIESDPYNNRIILYFPFEFLPHRDTEYRDTGCKIAVNNFRNAYLEAWESLLHVHDLRANFLDGDIPEVVSRTEPIPRAVIAVRLIPVLLEKKLLKLNRVFSMLKDTDDSILRKNVAEVLPILVDKNLITQEELKIMTTDDDVFVRDTANLVLAKQAENKLEEIKEIDSLSAFVNGVVVTVQRFQGEIENQSDLTEARRNWLSEDISNKVILDKANILADNIISNNLDLDELTEFTKKSDDILTTRLLVLTISSLVDKKPQLINPEYAKQLNEFLSSPNTSVRGDVERALFHMHAAEIINDEMLDEFGLNVPKLTDSFADRKGEINEVVKGVGEIISNLERVNPELASFIYPTAVLLGSRTKGYSAEGSDLDVAVFVRPNTSFDQHSYIKELLQQALGSEQITGSVMTFWLDEKNDGLWIKHNEDQGDRTLGTTVEVYALNGVWCGDKKAIKELHQGLLPEYLDSKDKVLYGESARRVWLEELERDTLQYRLMHKGYYKYFTEKSTMRTQHSDSIDGHSAFYDSGYRRMATKLFIDRVFLPQLNKPENV